MPSLRSSRRQLLRALLCSPLAGLLPAPAAQSAPPSRRESLADLLPADFDWDPARRGALLVVDPAGTRRVQPATAASARSSVAAAVQFLRALPAFDRKTVSVGALTVVAPTTMIQIADQPPRLPRLWDGLRRDERVQYLLSTLTPAQWEQIGGKDGLGAAGLSNADQRAVFQSLLPDPLVVREGIVGERGFLEKEKKRTLTEGERAGVRLRVRLTTGFDIPMSTGRSESIMPTGLFRGMPGERAVTRDDTDDHDSKEAYGAPMAHPVPNRPKPSDLDYDGDARLSGGVPLAGGKTVAGLCQSATAATGIELIADFRVAGLPVVTAGGPVRAGDLLQALALAVCGTWRRVGETDTYVLAADRTGAGARRLRLSDWYADLDARKQTQLSEWRRKNARDGVFQKFIGMRDDDPLGAQGALAERIAAAEKAGRDDPARTLKRSELTPGMQEYLRQMDTMYRMTAEKSDMTRVIPRREVIAQFVLPEGAPLTADMGLTLGPAWIFESTGESSAEQEAEEAFLKTLPRHEPIALPRGDSDGIGLSVTATTPEEARDAAAVARRYGFGRLWLHTADPRVAAAALAAAVTLPVWAVADVFGTADDTPGAEQDRNLLGEIGPTAAKARAAAARWPELVDSARRQSWPRPDATGFVGPGAVCTPQGTAFTARLEQLGALAAVNGLAGMVLTNLAPLGYAGERSASYTARYDAPLSIRAEFGYSVPIRQAFLRKEGIDPIDLIPDNLRFSADLRTPFFLDDHARSDSSVYDGTQQVVPGFPEKLARWNTFRREANRAALDRLWRTIASAQPGLPVFAAPVPKILPNGTLPTFGPPREYAEWKGGKTPPIASEEREEPLAVPLPGGRPPVYAMVFAAPHTDRDEQLIGLEFARFAPSATPQPPPQPRPAVVPDLVLDLSAMPLAAARKLLAHEVKAVDATPE